MLHGHLLQCHCHGVSSSTQCTHISHFIHDLASLHPQNLPLHCSIFVPTFYMFLKVEPNSQCIKAIAENEGDIICNRACALIR